jgi:cell division septum initiation protein DivIVA
VSVYRVIDKVETTLKEGGWLPFGYRVVSQEHMLDLIEKLRASLPDEVGRAKQVTKEKDRLLSQAKEQADKIVEEASTTKTQLLNDSEIARLAQSQADQLIAQAEARASEIRRGADDYADRILAQLDVTLGTALASVQKGRQALSSGLSAAASNGIRGRDHKA